MKDIPGEIWVVSYFNPIYHVSNLGRLKIFCKDLNRSKTYPRIGKVYKNRFGYYWSGLIDTDKNKKTWLTHRLVAVHFVPNIDNKPQVNHKNGIKTDNRAENLEWVTPLENTRHSNQTGLVNIRGERNPSSKLTKKQVIEIFSSKTPSKIICTLYGVSSTVIRQIRTGFIWSSVTGKQYKKQRFYDPDTKKLIR